MKINLKPKITLTEEDNHALSHTENLLQTLLAEMDGNCLSEIELSGETYTEEEIEKATDIIQDLYQEASEDY